MKTKESYKNRIESIVFKERAYRDPSFNAGSLADELGIPRHKLSRVLQAEFGKTYTDIVLPLKVKEAKHLLLAQRYAGFSVEIVAEKCGFANRQTFFSAFKTYTGMTPRQWREFKKHK